jgi:hypothetical protein
VHSEAGGTGLSLAGAPAGPTPPGVPRPARRRGHRSPALLTERLDASCCMGVMRTLVLALIAGLATACDGGAAFGQTAASPATDLCSAERSVRDTDGTLVGSTLDTTTIRVAAPQEIRATAETTFRVLMTGVSPLNVYAEQPRGAVGAWGRLSRVDPRTVELAGSDTWMVRMTFPTAGCWRLHTERAGGKLSGDVWVDVLPRS